MRKISLIVILIMILNTMIAAQTFYNGSIEDVVTGYTDKLTRQLVGSPLHVIMEVLLAQLI